MAIVAALAACGDRERPLAIDSGALDTEPPPGALGSVRRPATTYRMVHAGERCNVVFEQGGVEVRRLPKAYACPRDLEPEESLRITGMTCLREGGPPARNIPVVCPDYLTNAERDHRHELETQGLSPIDLQPLPTTSGAPSASAN